MDNLSLAENFDQYFEVKFANTKQLREESYRIRHSVYCDELEWEPKQQDGKESDECDDYSFALLLVHKRTGQYAGTARLVIHPPNEPDKKLPFEQHCLSSIWSEVINLADFPRGGFSEISRLAVPETFRRRAGEKNMPFVINDISLQSDVFSEEERRNFPNIAIGLYLSIIALAEMCLHLAMFVVAEPRLNKRLNRIGFLFEQIGDEHDFHGNRALFYLPREKFTSELNPEILELYSLLEKQLKQQMFLLPYLNR
ncbi:PEP-CTERM/exosortase system-associated acyltransferase [Rheinheimera sp. MMS21-TC3]|uniref:PEP-CTERM/exosortase system-associated acyltransferase n=1 Tax=Rheinheimera sp. MMS21-TC3 TaxID=3072790 RepID=UPI0028C447A9|nr:PEP-CTERM/exosortase system-associated acyltransferase [Rheinheimera sp. MMS21-TC3]WNO60669.1 PEP-CTERM/exosortase system-associated acyltransferase [Rheinheimera sp. MMS21-TC3]